jgi:hypothetical protein
MIEVTLGVDDVAAIRFTSCAVNETVASLRVLRHPQLHSLHAGHLRARVPAVPMFDLELLMALVEPEKWIAGILAPPPSAKPADALTQLRAVAHGETATAEDDLVVLRQHSARWVAMTAERLMEEVSAALAGYWRQVLEPVWERVQIITDADIAHRSATLAADGVGAAMAGLHDQIRYVDHRILPPTWTPRALQPDRARHDPRPPPVQIEQTDTLTICATTPRCMAGARTLPAQRACSCQRAWTVRAGRDGGAG